MKKKLVSLLAAAAMCAGLLAGCGSGGSAAKDSSKFYIGGIGPATGNAAMYGLAVQNGAQLAVDEINEAGGINGAKVEFNFQDDENDAEKALNAYNNLKDWGMQMLVGTVTTTPCLSVISSAEADNMFEITPSASAKDVIVPANVYQLCFQDPVQGTYAADFIAEDKLGEKVGIIYNSQDVYSSGIESAFKKEAEDKGLTIVSEEAFTNDSATDFTVQLQAAQKGGADLIFLPIYYTEASIILTQAKSLGIEAQFLGCDGFDGLTEVDNFDTSLAEGVKLLTPFTVNAEDDLTKDFVKNYKDKYDDIPTQFAADAYDCIYAIKAAVEEGDIKPDQDPSSICDAMMDAMGKISFDGLTGEGIRFNEDGSVDKAPKLVTIKNGEYELDH